MKTGMLIVVFLAGVCFAQAELNQSIELVNSGKYDEANRLIDTYLNKNARDHQANFIKAVILANLKNFGNAVPFIEKALLLKTDRAEYYQVAAQLYEALGKTKPAITAWEKCLAFAKDTRLFAEAKHHIGFLKNE